MVLKELIFTSFYFHVGVLVLIELIFKFLPWVGVVTLKALEPNSFYFKRVCRS